MRKIFNTSKICQITQSLSTIYIKEQPKIKYVRTVLPILDMQITKAKRTTQGTMNIYTVQFYTLFGDINLKLHNVHYVILFSEIGLQLNIFFRQICTNVIIKTVYLTSTICTYIAKKLIMNVAVWQIHFNFFVISEACFELK